MMTILRNRASIAQTVEEETQGDAVQKHVSAVTVKEILKAKGRGWDAARIAKEYKVDPSVLEKLGDFLAVPVDNEDGIVLPLRLDTNVG
jgi:hypothetical protein